VEGDEFTAEVVAQLLKIDEQETIRLLSDNLVKQHHLINSLGIKRVNGSRLSTYRFRHVLFQKYLYSNLDNVERIYLHEGIGNVLESFYGDKTAEIAGQLARHFQIAEIPEKAIDYLVQAAANARRVFANEESIEHLSRALGILEKASGSGIPGEKKHQLTSHIFEVLGDVLATMAKHDEARNAYQRADSKIKEKEKIRRSRIYRKIGKTFEVQRNFRMALENYNMAETALEKIPPKTNLEWWQEWIEVHTERIWMYYWQAKVSEMTGESEKVQTAVKKFGTPAQRSRFYQGLVLIAFRRDRYVISDETLANSQAAFSASQESDDLILKSMAQFLHGFTYLWRGEMDKADVELHDSLKIAEQTGDIVLQSRCLTYLTILYRKLGQIDKVREYIVHCQTTAESGEMIEYLATAEANLSWLYWREGNLAQAEKKGTKALKLWQQLPADHASGAMKWTALWPLFGKSVLQEKLSKAVKYIDALCDISQQRMPQILEESVIEIKNISKKNDPKKLKICLENAMNLAQQLGYL
jgi:tetratricopeptide (TPR) repeat protein